MTRIIRIPDELYERLQAHGVAFVDTEATVIGRLLNFYDEKAGRNGGTQPIDADGALRANSARGARTPSSRAPRERGVTVELEGELIHASSLREMYERALQLVVERSEKSRLEQLVPFATSGVRYLIAKKPVHPNGNEFVKPVRYGGYYMESHKDYRNGMRHLSKFVEKLGLTLRYLG